MLKRVFSKTTAFIASSSFAILTSGCTIERDADGVLKDGTGLLSTDGVTSAIEWKVNNRFAPFETLRDLKDPNGESMSDKVFREWSLKDENTTLQEWHKALWERPNSPLRNGSPYAPYIGTDLVHWDSKTEEHHKTVLDYVKRESADTTTVSVSVKTDQPGTCTWRVPTSEPVQGTCREWTVIRVPLKGAEVSFQAGDVSDSGPVNPKHLVIVGFGGSYGSGEGNPDRPTDWRDIRPRRNTINWLRRTSSYTKNGKAAWLDDDCHRSFFSQQSLTALALASEDEQRFVSFLHYACTGADIFGGHLSPHKSPGNSKGFNRFSQLNAALRDLCASILLSRLDFEPVDSGLNGMPIDLEAFVMRYGFDGKRGRHGVMSLCPSGNLRKPDLVLLEAGGNEIGFADLVRFWVAPHKTRFLRIENLARPKVCPEPKNRAIVNAATERFCKRKKFSIAELRLGKFRDETRINTGRLVDQFKFYYTSVQRYLGIQPAQIVQISYPDPLRDGTPVNGKCGQRKNITGVYGDSEKWTQDGPWEALKVIVPPNRLIKRWHFNITRAEALCLLDQANDLRASMELAATPKGIGLVSATADAFVGHGWREGKYLSLPTHGDRWNLRDWEPYEYDANGRALRTPNDSYLTQSQGLLTNFFGTAHPNLMGHTLIADIVLKSDQLRSIVPAPVQEVGPLASN